MAEKESDEIELGYDLDKVPGSSDVDVLKEGRYLVTIAKVTQGKDEDKPQIFITATVVDAELPENADQKGKSFLDNISLQPNAAWKMKQFLDAVYGQAKGTKLRLADLVGRKMVVETFNDNYTGSLRTKSKRFSSASKWTNPPTTNAAGVTAQGSKGGDEEVSI